MSHFYASVDASPNRGTATKTGTKKSGMNAHVRTWEYGVRVVAHHTAAGADLFDIYVTSGSTGGASDRLIATVTPDGVEIIESAGVAR